MDVVRTVVVLYRVDIGSTRDPLLPRRTEKRALLSVPASCRSRSCACIRHPKSPSGRTNPKPATSASTPDSKYKHGHVCDMHRMSSSDSHPASDSWSHGPRTPALNGDLAPPNKRPNRPRTTHAMIITAAFSPTIAAQLRPSSNRTPL